MEDDVSGFYEYSIKYTDIYIIKYTFENTSYVSAIVNDITLYKHVDKLDILFDASYSDLNMFLNICEINSKNQNNLSKF